MKRVRTNETPTLTLAIVAECRRKQGDGTVGTRAVSQLTVWQWLTRARRVYAYLMNHEFKNRQTPRYQQLFKTSGEGRKGTDQSKHAAPTLSGLRRCGCGLAYKRMWVWFRAHAHKTSNKNFLLKYFRCRDGKRTETRIGMEGICITHSCIPPL